MLFATSSFWQGVDVQGEQLSCVIIDRLPFAVPSDPVVAARVKAIDAEGGNAFFQYQVPAAVITLKQGFGRLIRSLHDRGLLVLLDNRILKKQYGRVFVDSLPNYKRTTDLRVVEELLRGGELIPAISSRSTRSMSDGGIHLLDRNWLPRWSWNIPFNSRTEHFAATMANFPLSISTNSTRSPASSPRASRTVTGMVTWPFDVIVADAMLAPYCISYSIVKNLSLYVTKTLF